jgi:tetratricopeptide (TPR) repeat protein
MKIKKILSFILVGFLFFTSVPFAVGQESSKDRYVSEVSETTEELRSAGKFKESAESLEKLSNIFHDKQDWRNLAGAYSNLGILYLELGEASKAFQKWELAAFYYRKIKDSESTIRSVLYQSKALQVSGLYSQSCQVLFSEIIRKCPRG